MALTACLFFIYYRKIDVLQRVNDPNRVTNLKTAMELEDLDFVKMVEDMNIQLNEVDLRDMEKTLDSKINKVIPGERSSL